MSTPTEPPAAPDNVIRVRFGLGGHRVVGHTAPLAEAHPAGDPVTAVYSRDEVARILGLEPTRLRTWERIGLARPSAEERGARRYTFEDLVAVRTARDLVERGVPTARVRRALDALRLGLPGGRRLSELRVISDGTSVAVRAGSATIDALTGQVLIDFSVGALRDDVVRALPARRTRHGARTAYDYFLEGCRLDGDEAGRARAAAAYRKAIELDPSLASAYTNLGTLCLLDGARGEAEALFRRALAIDPEQSEAPYNLGFLRLEDRRYDEAIALLGQAVERDPEFADAHFNLAVAYEEAGRDADALPHWEAYLALEPVGPFASAARARVGRPR